MICGSSHQLKWHRKKPSFSLCVYLLAIYKFCNSDLFGSYQTALRQCDYNLIWSWLWSLWSSLSKCFHWLLQRWYQVAWRACSAPSQGHYLQTSSSWWPWSTTATTLTPSSRASPRRRCLETTWTPTVSITLYNDCIWICTAPNPVSESSNLYLLATQCMLAPHYRSKGITSQVDIGFH